MEPDGGMSRDWPRARLLQFHPLKNGLGPGPVLARGRADTPSGSLAGRDEKFSTFLPWPAGWPAGRIDLFCQRLGQIDALA